MRTRIKDYLHDLMDFIDESLAGADDPSRRQADLLAVMGGYTAIRHRVHRESPRLNAQFELLGLHDKASTLANLMDREYLSAAIDLKAANIAFRKVIQKAPLDFVIQKALPDEEPWPDQSPYCAS